MCAGSQARARAHNGGAGAGGGGASEGGSQRERERVGSRTHGVKPILANRAEAAAQAADHQQPHLRHKHFPGYYDELTGERESACPVPSTQAARPPTRRCSRAAAPPHGSLIAPAPRWEAWPYCAPLAVGRASTASAAARLQRGHWQRGCVLGTGRLARLTLLVHPPPDRVPRCRRAAGRAPHRRPRCIGDAHAAAHRRNSYRGLATHLGSRPSFYNALRAVSHFSILLNSDVSQPVKIWGVSSRNRSGIGW